MPPATKGDDRYLHFEPTGAPHTFRTTVPADLLYFQGHFAELPLLPAVAQLSRVVLPLIRREYPDLGAVRKLRRLRFRRPIPPDATLTITLSRTDHRVSFEIALPDHIAATGILELEPRPGTTD